MAKTRRVIVVVDVLLWWLKPLTEIAC